MFTILSAYGIEQSQFASWGTTEDISNLTVDQVIAKYRKIYVTLQRDGTNSTIRVDLFRQIPVLSVMTGSMGDIFATWDQALIELVDELVPQMRMGVVSYFDLLYAGYKVDAVTEGGTINTDVNSISDLMISRGNTEISAINDHILFNVNGFYYRHEVFGDKIIVPNAARSMRHVNHNLVGGISFEALGKITQHSIPQGSIIAATEGQPLRKGIVVRLPVGSANKGVLIVIGGYLHALDFHSVIERIDDELVLFYPEHMNLISRYAESKPYLELGYQLPEGVERNDAVDEEYLMSDEVLMQLFTNLNSFFVVCDCPPIKSSVHQLHSMKTPGRFISSKEPNDILISGFGYVMNYWKIKEGGLWGQHAGIREKVADHMHQESTGTLVSHSYRGTITDRFPQAQVLRLISDIPVV